MFSPFAHKSLFAGNGGAAGARSGTLGAAARRGVARGSGFCRRLFDSAGRSRICWLRDCTKTTEVVSIGRDGLLKGELVDDESPRRRLFRILLRGHRSRRTRPAADCHGDIVIDTTGTYGNHNWFGAGGDSGDRRAGCPRTCPVRPARRARRGSRPIMPAATFCWSEPAIRRPRTWWHSPSWPARPPILGSLGSRGANRTRKFPEPLRPVADDRLAERQRLTPTANRPWRRRGQSHHVFSAAPRWRPSPGTPTCSGFRSGVGASRRRNGVRSHHRQTSAPAPTINSSTSFTSGACHFHRRREKAFQGPCRPQRGLTTPIPLTFGPDNAAHSPSPTSTSWAPRATAATRAF